MDWDSLSNSAAEVAWGLALRLPDATTIKLERVPDIAAWVLCGALGLWCFRLVAVRRPRVFVGSLAAWLLWLGWQVCFKDGRRALEAAHRRGAAAIEATDRFTQELVALVRAWAHFFLPFLSDVSRWAAAAWRQMTVRQRMLLVGGLLSGYAVLEAFRYLRKHRKTVTCVLFHASFLLAGPALWQLAGLLPPEWVPVCLTHAVTTVPTLASLLVLGHAERLKERAEALRRGAKAPPPGVRLWLSYWSCWPMLAVMEWSLLALPRLTPYYGQVGQLQGDLRRVMLVFVLWLQVWQGCRFLQYTLSGLLQNTSVLETIAMCFGSRGLQLLGFARGNLGAGGAAMTMSGFQVFRKLTRRLWLVAVGASAAIALILVLVWLFYRAVAGVSSVITMALWCFAAMDSADTLSSGSRDLYPRKLAFWVLAMLWGFSTKLPYVGVILGLFTPFAFSLWLVAGDPILRRLVLPFLQRATGPFMALSSTAISALEVASASRRMGPPSGCSRSGDDAAADDTGGVGGGREDADALSGVEDTGGTGGVKTHSGKGSRADLAGETEEDDGSLRRRKGSAQAAKAAKD